MTRVRKQVVRVRKQVWRVKKQVWRVKKQVWRVKKQVWRVKKQAWRVKKQAWRLKKLVLRARKQVVRVKKQALRMRKQPALIPWVRAKSLDQRRSVPIPDTGRLVVLKRDAEARGGLGRIRALPPNAVARTPSPPAAGSGLGRGGPFAQEIPLSPALSPLLRRREREKSGAVPECARRLVRTAFCLSAPGAWLLHLCACPT